MNNEDISQQEKENSPALLRVSRNGSWKCFKDPEPRTKLVYFFLILWLLSQVTVPLSRMQMPEGQIPELFTIADIISYPAFLALVVCYFFWLTRVTENALLLSPSRRVVLSPIRHLLYYILPVWNLYGPYDGMKTVYEETRKMISEEKKPPLFLIRMWWLLVLNAAASPFYLSDAGSLFHTIFQCPDITAPALFSLSLVTFFVVTAGFATFLVIRKVTLFQKDILDNLTTLEQDRP